MRRRFLAPFAKLLASFSVAALFCAPSITEAAADSTNIEQAPVLEQKATIEISDFVLQRSGDTDSSSQFHSSHYSHRSHSSHQSHYSSHF
ncbi:MAG: hypothetical protein ACE5HI_19220 [bacterium]